MNIFRGFFSFCLSWTFCFSSAAYADNLSNNAAEHIFDQVSSLCPVAKTLDQRGNLALFWQHDFEGGVQDLAMAKPLTGESLNIKRVTFGGASSKACHYKSLAIAQGGEWGWHLAWFADNTSTVSYARMDGEAWVSSPTKKLSKNAQMADALAILTFAQQVWVVWLETKNNMHNVYTVFSNDEGRSWQEAKQLTQTSVDIRQLKLIIKEQQPYLIWDGEDNGVPLPAW